MLLWGSFVNYVFFKLLFKKFNLLITKIIIQKMSYHLLILDVTSKISRNEVLID